MSTPPSKVDKSFYNLRLRWNALSTNRLGTYLHHIYGSSETRKQLPYLHKHVTQVNFFFILTIYRLYFFSFCLLGYYGWSGEILILLINLFCATVTSNGGTLRPFGEPASVNLLLPSALHYVHTTIRVHIFVLASHTYGFLQQCQFSTFNSGFSDDVIRIVTKMHWIIKTKRIYYL